MSLRSRLLKALGAVDKVYHLERMAQVRQQRDAREKDLIKLCTNPKSEEATKIINHWRYL